MRTELRISMVLEDTLGGEHATHELLPPGNPRQLSGYRSHVGDTYAAL